MNNFGIKAILDELLIESDVLGGSLKCIYGDDTYSDWWGISNLNTGDEVVENTAFQIGSISKLFTAVLVFQLLDEGLISLDTPVKVYIPYFEILNSRYSSDITLRHLLGHTSGIDGDFMPSDDAFDCSSRAYISKMRLLPSLHAPGEIMTYCNSGYVVAGHVVETIRKMPWNAAVEKYILNVIKTTNSFASLNSSIAYKTAIGHQINIAGANSFKVSPISHLPLSLAAAGSTLTMTPDDLLKFVTAIHRSENDDVQPLITEKSKRIMLSVNQRLPKFSREGYTYFGLGWFIGKNGNDLVYGHDGSTAGQQSYMFCIPSKNFYFSMLTNSPSGKLATNLRRKIMDKIFGITSSPVEIESISELSPSRYVGTYENVAAKMDISEKNGSLFVTMESKRADVQMSYSAELSGGKDGVFYINNESSEEKSVITFLKETEGRFRFVRQGLRMAKRVA